MVDTLLPSQVPTIVMDANQEGLLLETRSHLMSEFIEAAHRAAMTDATILLGGDSGTGKSAFAHQIHRWSGRGEDRFLNVDCAALSDHAHESDPFEALRNSLAVMNRVRGYRNDVSDAATLFLDNLADLQASAQARLLQFVEDRQSVAHSSSTNAGARIIAASSRDLAAEMSAGRFRSDLFYRINVIALQIPALVDRREDIPGLAKHLLVQAARRNSRQGLRLSNEAVSTLSGYHWPGNVRELRNAVERAAVLCTSDLVTEEHLPDAVLNSKQPCLSHDGRRLTSLEEVERRHIIRMLQASSTMEEAAAALGINCSTLWRKRKLYNIE
jgi:NtrC-family two-component system response regulator AlgB